MNANEIEPGMLLLGPNGETREVIQADPEGINCWYAKPGGTQTHKITKHGLARWVRQDITEPEAA